MHMIKRWVEGIYYVVKVQVEVVGTPLSQLQAGMGFFRQEEPGGKVPAGGRAHVGSFSKPCHGI